jgi:hypothetical protein
MPELLTIQEVAARFGVSLSRAYTLLSENGIRRVSGYPADRVAAIPRPGQGARTDLVANREERPLTAKTQGEVDSMVADMLSYADRVISWIRVPQNDTEAAALDLALRVRNVDDQLIHGAPFPAMWLQVDRS